ncbi:UDP-galactopyranose mutase [Bacillus sp. OV194]|nr:UDP-galactopyranose mutase [Bacillus sp. OV194]
MYDFLIVGAGFSGCVLAQQIASILNKRVLLIDKRNHIAGNAYDYYNEAGILVHKYGPHIFHTNSKKVFNYLSRFTEWIYYQHKVLASVDGKKVPIPINLNTINELYGLRLSEREMQDFYQSIRVPFDKITNSEEVVVNKVGYDLYEKFFKHYTKKQWNLWPSELQPSVCARIPVRTNRDDRYFTDKYQVMPKYGYAEMFKKMIRHSNIHLMLQTDYKDIAPTIPHGKVIYTGPIDSFFNYKFGKLPYRSLEFEFVTLDKERFQETAQVNYPNEYDYTRIAEFKYITGQNHPKTTIAFEFPTDSGDPYYPIPKNENIELYKKYKEEADKMTNVWFLGRLGTYQYYNMDQVVAQALAFFENKLNK